MPRLRSEPLETFLKFTEEGPIIEKWDPNGYVIEREVKLTTEEALEMKFTKNILDHLPNKRKLIWIESLLDEEALIIYCLPYVLLSGKPFPCKVMNAPRVKVNRSSQINHLKRCKDCASMACTDYHPSLVKVGVNTIWKIVINGLLELIDTSFDPYPTYNGLPVLTDGIPSKHGKHRLIFGIGKHSRRNDHEWDEDASISHRAGFQQSKMILLMRIVSNITKIYGNLNIGYSDFKPAGRDFLKVLKSDFKSSINHALNDLAYDLSPLLRVVNDDLAVTEPQSVLDFRQRFYVERKFEFDYVELEGKANSILDTLGLNFLKFLTILPPMNLKISLRETFGSTFTDKFINRNLVKIDSTYQVKESIDANQPKYDLNLVEYYST